MAVGWAGESRGWASWGQQGSWRAIWAAIGLEALADHFGPHASHVAVAQPGVGRHLCWQKCYARLAHRPDLDPFGNRRLDALHIPVLSLESGGCLFV